MFSAASIFQTTALIFFQGNNFFSWTFFFVTEPQTPGFPDLNSKYAEAQHVISLVIGDSVLCLFINQRIQDMPLLFSPNVAKIHNQPVPVATRVGFCSRAQNVNFGHSKMCIHSFPVVCCLHTLNYLLQWGVKQFYMFVFWCCICGRELTCASISLKFSSSTKLFRRGSSWDDRLNSSHRRVPACSVVVVSSCVSHSQSYWFYWNSLNSFYL